MLWRRRNEGFEWKEYVRTTVLLRRKERRQKLDGAKQAAAEGLKEAGRQGLKAGAAGAEKAGQAAVAIAQRVGSGAVEGSAAAAAVAASGASALRQSIARASAPMTARLATSRLRWPLGLAALALTGMSGARAAQFGFDTDAAVTGLTGAVAALLWLWPWLFPDPAADAATVALPADRTPFTTRAGETYRALTGHEPPQSLIPIAAAGVFAAVMVWLAWPSLTRLATLPFAETAPSAGPARTPAPEPGTGLSGTARVIGPAQLRIAGTDIVLSDITPLAAAQKCRRENGDLWDCGRAARQAMEKMVRGRKVTCTFAGTGDPRPASCLAGSTDVAAEITRQGHAFADGIFFATYASQQDEAEAAKAGLWAGTPEWPEAWRTRLWAEAEAAAPDGCPIKGRVTGGTRHYVLPEDTDYARAAVRESRGEAWFCSEDDAKAAGFTRRD